MQLTVKQAARFLDVTEEQIHAWVDEGAIPFARGPSGIRFNEAELLEWANARSHRASHQTLEAPVSAVSLAAALALGGVHHGVPGADVEGVLRAAVAFLPLGPGADPETLVEVLLAREAAGSTATGDGIAIPHVRSPIVLHGPHTAIALCTLAQPVSFGARDGKPTHTIFLIATPTVDAHLKTLARLAAALHDAEFKAAVLAKKPQDEVVAIARRLDTAPKAGRQP